ncbi:MAG: hypothetical protein WC333_00310 [Dehalococcoidia bacterium]|jgi:hypothetical protein
MKDRLELRMYFFVPYNISPIQQAIQAGHAALEYARKYGQTDLFIDFIDDWKTWIILNGGTTNESISPVFRGSLNTISDELRMNEIQHAYFNEPDLNNALTAVCFIVDERVFNKEDYPDFVDYLDQLVNPGNDPMYSIKLKIKTNDELNSMVLLDGSSVDKIHNDWLELIGGKKNEFLRELLNGKKLA